MKLKQRSNYSVDLQDLHAVCEANYARLLRLFPDYENRNQRQLEIGPARVELTVIERCRYTTIFRLQQWHGESEWLGSLNIELRAYHDARMLEVAGFQSHRSVRGRYQYPNRRMYQQDEKAQQNAFLAEWFGHALHHGQAPLAQVVASGR